MNVGSLFRRLSFGELSNLALSFNGNGNIREEAHTKIIQYANEGLLRLYSRFVLFENSLLLEQVGSITSYPLTVAYAVSNTGSSAPHKYIKDTQTPFEDDILKILKVNDESGFVFPLNDEENANSLFTPKANVLQIPLPQDGVVLAVTYQAKCASIDPSLTGSELTDQTFDLPVTLEGALQAYVASLTFSHMNGQENLIKSQEYEARYEKICAEVEKMDLVSQSMSTTNTRFELGGWI